MSLNQTATAANNNVLVSFTPKHGHPAGHHRQKAKFQQGSMFWNNHNMVPQKLFCSKDCFLNSLFPYTIQEWNLLPENVVNVVWKILRLSRGIIIRCAKALLVCQVLMHILLKLAMCTCTMSIVARAIIFAVNTWFCNLCWLFSVFPIPILVLWRTNIVCTIKTNQ